MVTLEELAAILEGEAITRQRESDEMRHGTMGQYETPEANEINWRVQAGIANAFAELAVSIRNYL